MRKNELSPTLLILLLMAFLTAPSLRADESPPSTDDGADVPIAHRIDAEIAVLKDPKSSTEQKNEVCQKLLALEGRAWPATEALIELMDDPKLNPSAEQILRQIGPVAAKALGRHIAKLEGNWQGYTLVLASIHQGTNAAVPPLCEAVALGTAPEKVVALRALAGIGNSSRSAWPEIRAALEDESIGVRWAALRAAEAALDIDHSATEQVLDLSKNAGEQAVAQLMRYPKPADLIPALIYQSQAEDKKVSTEAMLIWSSLTNQSAIARRTIAPRQSGIFVKWPVTRPLDDEVLEAIQYSLRSPQSASALLDMVVDGRLELKPYMPFVIEAMSVESTTVREVALSKAAEMGPKLTSLLTEAAECGDPRLRLRAVHAMALLLPKSENAAVALEAILASGADDVKAQAILELGQSGEAAKPTIGRLIAIAKGNDRFAGMAIAALANLGEAVKADAPAGKAAVELLSRRALNEQDKHKFISSIGWARVAPGTDDRQINSLLAIRKSTDSTFRAFATETLFIQPRTAKLVPAMVSLLDDADNDLRMRAMEVLSAIGPDAKPAAARLSRLVDNNLAPLRQAAARTLVRVDPSSAQLVAAYVAAVRNNDLDAQATLAQAIRRSPESADRASTRLTELASAEPDETVRTHARAAMVAIGK